MLLAERFTQGETGAFEELFRAYQGEVYRWILRLVRDTAAAEDLTIETFWRIYRARARFDPGREFGPWARRIATNLAIGHLRHARPSVEPAQELADARGESAEERQAIARAFAALPAKLKAVAELALIEQIPYAEIADALGISVAAVKSREFRAVRRLRELLRKEGIER
jgi:RNA polymerase sigma-70 factor (ECF subfamily)